MGLVLDAYFKVAFTCQADAAKAAAKMRFEHLCSHKNIMELGKHFLLKDCHAACLDLAEAIEAVHSRFVGYASGGRSTDMADEGIAVAGQSNTLLSFVATLQSKAVYPI